MASGKNLGVNTVIDRKNFDQILAQSTGEDKTLGLTWYPRARGQITDMSLDYEIPSIVETAVVALTSPMRRWIENVATADQITRLWMEGKSSNDFVGSMINRDILTKGFKVLDLWKDNPSQKSFDFWFGVVNSLNPNGRKVPSFFANLVKPGQTRLVTVDSHIAAIAIGNPKPASYGIHPKLYLRIETMIQELADDYNVSPDSMQSWAWTIRKRLVPDRSIKK